jgi:hypothetical protein
MIARKLSNLIWEAVVPRRDPVGTKSTNSAHGRAPRRGTPRRIAILGATLLGAAAFAGPAEAGIGVPHAPANFANPTDPLGHFPAWYQDDEGQQVALCVDPAAAECGGIVLPDPNLPLSFSATVPADNNFPDESFYQRAQAIVGGNILLTLAQEATYGGTDGTQGVFGRVRIKDIDNELTAGQWYRFTYPGGQKDLQAPVNDSSDVGCGPAIGAACDSNAAFNAPLGSQLNPSFLQKDRSTGAAAPPAGLLADVGTQAVVGSKFVPPGDTQPSNYFRIEQISGNGGAVTGLVGQNNQFDLLAPGRIFAGARAGILLNSSGQLGSQRVSVASTGKAVTITNAGSGLLQLDTLAVGGADAAQFAVNTAPCTSRNLSVGGSCEMPVVFTPNGTGPRSAQINVTQTTALGPKVRVVKLLGNGVQPTLTLPAAAVAFGNQLVGSVVGPRAVSVSNTGTDTLHVASATLGGATPGDYTLGLNTCNNQDVPAGGQCTVEVNFTPTAGGERPAALNVSTTDAGSGSVAISGTGVATAAAVTPGAAAGAIVGTPAPNIAQSTATKLKLTSLGGSRRIKRSKATKSGIRLSMRLQDGTKVVRIRIYRKTKTGRKLISDGFKSPASTTGTYRVQQSHLGLRRSLRTLGTYQVEVTPGASRTDLGTTSRLTFKIVR